MHGLFQGFATRQWASRSSVRIGNWSTHPRMLTAAMGNDKEMVGDAIYGGFTSALVSLKDQFPGLALTEQYFFF